MAVITWNVPNYAERGGYIFAHWENSQDTASSYELQLVGDGDEIAYYSTGIDNSSGIGTVQIPVPGDLPGGQTYSVRILQAIDGVWNDDPSPSMPVGNALTHAGLFIDVEGGDYSVGVWQFRVRLSNPAAAPALVATVSVYVPQGDGTWIFVGSGTVGGSGTAYAAGFVTSEPYDLNAAGVIPGDLFPVQTQAVQVGAVYVDDTFIEFGVSYPPKELDFIVVDDPPQIVAGQVYNIGLIRTGGEDGETWANVVLQCTAGKWVSTNSTTDGSAGAPGTYPWQAPATPGAVNFTANFSELGDQGSPGFAGNNGFTVTVVAAPAKAGMLLVI